MRNEEESQTAALLRDIHQVFEANGTGHYRTADLIDELVKIEESPWGDWYGKPITSHGLSKLLRPYRIKTMPVWVEGEARRGYKREQFADAFHRVLSVRSVRPGSQSQNGLTGPNAPNASEIQGVRPEAASKAAPNAPNAPNASVTEEGTNGRVPVYPGDPDFPDLVDLAFHHGHLTETEWLERRKVHALVVTTTPA
jgi:hypothetical protein